MPARERGRLHDGERLAPREAAGEEDEWEPERVRCPSGFQLPLVVQGQPLPEEEILGGEGGPGPKTRAYEPHQIDRKFD